MENGVDNSLRVDKHYLGYKGTLHDRSLAETCSTYFGAFANLQKMTVSFVISVQPSVSLSVRFSVPLSAWNTLASIGWIFMKTGINKFFSKICQENPIFVKCDESTSHDDLCKFIKIYRKEMYISLLFFLYKRPDDRLIN